MKILDTARLTLRELTEDDSAFILRLLNEPSFVRFIGDRGVRTIDDAHRYLLNGPIGSYARFGFGLYLVQLRAEETSIGICGLIKRENLDDVDIGFAFLPKFWSNGYAVESGAAVLTHGRDVIGLKRIVAIVSPDNERSMAVLEKLGLRFERFIAWPNDGSQLKLYATEA